MYKCFSLAYHLFPFYLFYFLCCPFFHYIKLLLIFLTLPLFMDFTSAVVIFVILVLFYLTGTFYAFQLHLQETMRMSPRSSKKRTNVSTHLLATTLKHVERDKQAFIKTSHGLCKEAVGYMRICSECPAVQAVNILLLRPNLTPQVQLASEAKAA